MTRSHDGSGMDRRAFLSLGALGLAAAALATFEVVDELRSSDPAITPQRFGAIGDGVSDSTAAFTQALATSRNVVVPRTHGGVFRLTDTVPFVLPGTALRFEPGIRVIGQTDGPMFQSIGLDGISVEGQGVLFDLDETAPNALRIVGRENKTVSGVRITDVEVANNALLAKATSAVEVREARSVVVDGVTVSGYGQRIPLDLDLQVYCVGFFDCTDVTVTRANLSDASIGIEIQRCRNLSVRTFSISDTTDNGVYILAGSEGLSLAGGTIHHAEEGIVLLSPKVDIHDVTLSDCTNKGITVRNSDGTTIHDCTFDGNAIGIGDDDSGRVSHDVSFTDNVFSDSDREQVLLRALSGATFSGNRFTVSDTTSAYSHLRLDDVDGATIRGNRFSGGRDAGKSAIRLGGSASGCDIISNEFSDVEVAVELVSDSSSTPAIPSVKGNTFRGVVQEANFSS